MYADTISPSMKEAIDETNRRREIQMRYNEVHGIIPQTIKKELPQTVTVKKVDSKEDVSKKQRQKMSKEEKMALIGELEEEMRAYAKDLNFEMAAQIRDCIMELKASK